MQCATINLKPGQTQAKHSLTVPVSAGCIMLEYASFWENLSVSSAEVLQCPRCSQVVSNPQGYCRYCKENAYQCRHCRSACCALTCVFRRLNLSTHKSLLAAWVCVASVACVEVPKTQIFIQDDLSSSTFLQPHLHS